MRAFGTRVAAPTEFTVGQAADIGDGETLTINEDGSYTYSKNAPFESGRGKRVYLSVATPPSFTTENYRTVLTSQGIGQSFVNSLTVAVPATIIPILIAAFAAYALSWMEFPGRALIIAMVVGLIVVPLQMSLIPLLKMYNEIGNFFGVPSRSYAGIWLAHSAFGMPLAIYLLRNYIAGLPRKSSNPPASTAPAISRSSSRSSFRCHSLRSHPSLSSSSSGHGTTFSSPWSSSEPARISWSSPAL